MLCVSMKPFDNPGKRTQRNSPNPLERPPSLLHNHCQQQNVDRRLSETNTGLASGDFFQQQPSSSGGSAFGSASSMSFQQNSLNTNNIQLRDQLLSSLASQIMSQRPMMMNFNLPTTHQQSLPSRVSAGSVQAMTIGSNPTAPSLANNKGDTDRDSQTDFQKAGCTRVPCQARGMATDHNALTAFLEIPNDAVHGLHLLCSQPTCRSVGVKFRYCYFCKKPVTKQNFRSRHLHADLAEKEKHKTSAAPQAMMPMLAGNTADTMCLPVSSFAAPPSPPLALHQLSNTNLFVGNSESNVSPRSNLQSLIDAANANQKRSREESNRSAQQNQWAALLAERPSNMMLIPGWLSKVVSTSQRQNPDDPPSPVPLSTSPLDQQSRWNKLLSERPDDTEDDGQVNSWLVQVLEVSAPTRCKSPASVDSYAALSQRLHSPSSLSDGNLQQPFLSGGDAEPASKRRKV